MPPRKSTRQNPPAPLPTTHAELEQLMEARIAAAIAQYDANRADQSGGTGGTSQGGTNINTRNNAGI